MSELVAAFALFDDQVSADEKRLVVKALNAKQGSAEPLKQIPPCYGPVRKALIYILERFEELMKYV